MKAIIKHIFLVGIIAIHCSGCHIFRQQSVQSAPPENPISKKKNGSQQYHKVITDEAITREGLFKVHQKENNYFFEIPDSLLGRDILIVSRIHRAAVQQPDVKQHLYNGDLINSSTVRFEKGHKNNIYLRLVSYSDQSQDSTENGMYKTVKNANLQPIVAAFDIKAYSPDSAGVVIDITKFIEDENDLLFFNDGLKGAAGIGQFEADKSYIEEIRSFPRNVEILTVKTYKPSGDYADLGYTYRINNSIVLLPHHPMRPRYSDPRVGYFTEHYRDYDLEPQGVTRSVMITRWRLEPRPEDRERYLQGELVEPVKPIVFYIDPTTPKKWVPYLKQGVNDWQQAFEKAGFKNAIYALEAPIDDPSWSLEDARHSAIVYKPSGIKNAQGPHIHDPRSGEILESHVNWYHNVMQLAHDWYMIQAGAIDPRARKVMYKDELMGRLIRFICAHEVGHTLGLQHNMGASSTVPTDSLRDKNWVEANGHTPSIMDYARFNYVAQPEDSIGEQGIMPRIGVYDEWAIEWGYRWFPGFESIEEEKEFMHNWTKDRIASNPKLWFGAMPFAYGKEDPRRQMEDLGNDAVKSSEYGIKNLKRIVPHLMEWTSADNADFPGWEDLHRRVAVQFYLYLQHVTQIVGGIKFNTRFIDEEAAMHEPVSPEEQRRALDFLTRHLFSNPLDWLFKTSNGQPVYAFSYRNQEYTTSALQKHILVQLLSYRKLYTLLKIEDDLSRNSDNLSIEEYLGYLKDNIWGELKTKQPIPQFKRNLQKIYAEQLVLMTYPTFGAKERYLATMNLQGGNSVNTDVMSMVIGHKEKLIEEINSAIPYKEGITKLHLMDIKERLELSITSQEKTEQIFIQPIISIYDCFQPGCF